MKPRFHHRSTRGYAIAIREALDPAALPSKVRSLADMTPAEVAALRARYETKEIPHGRDDKPEFVPGGPQKAR